MRIVVVGAGHVGSYIIQELSKEGHDIVVIDTDLKKINNLVTVYDVLGVHGNGVIASVMEEADVKRADMLIAVAENDEINILCSLMAKSYGVPNTIARVRSPEYSAQAEFMRDHLGINYLVNPEEELAAEVTRMLRFPFASKVESIAHGKVDLVEFKVSADSLLVGKAVKELFLMFQIDFLICAVNRNDEITIPSGNFVFQAGDILNVTATPKNIEAFFRKIGKFQKKARSVIIAGGGMIGYYLAKSLSLAGYNVKVISPDEDDCLTLREGLPDRVNVVQGDASEKELMEEEGIQDCDALVAITDSDEKNIVISLTAKSSGVPKIITKVDNDYSRILLDEVNLDDVVLKKKVTGVQIVRLARSFRSLSGQGLKKLYRIARDRAEALVFCIGDTAEFVGKALKDIAFRDNVLVACVVRNREIIIPNGNTVLEADDNIIVVTSHKSLIDLKDILK